MEFVYAMIALAMLMNLCMFCFDLNYIDREFEPIRSYNCLYSNDVFKINLDGEELKCMVHDNNQGRLFTQFKTLNKKNDIVFSIRTDTLITLDFQYLGSAGMYNYLISF